MARFVTVVPPKSDASLCHLVLIKPTHYDDGYPIQWVKAEIPSNTSLDLGRGCPYQCSFCTIINVQGRKSRFRSPDDLEGAIRENYRQGNRRFFITDDNFACNRYWEPLFDRMIQLRLVKGVKIGFTIQVDTLCHRIPNFIEKAAEAGSAGSSSVSRTSVPTI